MKLTLLKWHPYSNRQLDMRGSLSAYKTASDGFRTYNNINFNLSDGVNTRQTINYTPAESDDFEADYLIVSSNDTEDATSNNVVSRWYILESHWNRQKQRVLTLKRDLVADTWNTIKGFDFYCEKGLVGISDDFIFTNEPLTFNQRLTQSVSISDTANSSVAGWIALFIDTNYAGGGIPVEPGIVDYSPIDTHPLYKYFNDGTRLTPTVANGVFDFYMTASDIYNPQSTYVQSNGKCNDGKYRYWHITYSRNGTTPSQVQLETYNSLYPYNVGYNYDYTDSLAVNALNSAVQSGTWDDAVTVVDEYNLNDEHTKTRELSLVNRKFTSEGQGYMITLQAQPTIPDYDPLHNGNTKSFFDWFKDRVGTRWTQYGRTSNQPSEQDDGGRIDYIEYPYTLSKISVSVQMSTFPAVQQLIGQPYGILYTPYSTDALDYTSYIASVLGSHCYDVQLIHYKPPASTFTFTTTYKSITHTFTWASSDTTTINYALTRAVYPECDTSAKLKWASISKFIRIVSPDGSAMLEFNPAKARQADGNIEFTLAQKLVPNSTYHTIFVPMTGLYGTNPAYAHNYLRYRLNNTLPRVSNAWEEYKINNSSYQDAFNRQIENMEINHTWEQKERMWATGTTVAGLGFAGYKLGGPLGAVAGVGIGAVAGLADYHIANEKFEESLDYTKDQFGFNITNIQARPNSLLATAGASQNPYATIEVYEATSDEQMAWVKFVKYNAWTVNKVSTLTTMASNTDSGISTFIKGYLCKFSDNNNTLHEDAHFTSELNNELQRGFYYVNTI